MKPPFWATTLTIIGLIILCGLGKWQLDRLVWKEALLANIESAIAKDPMSHELGSTENDFTSGFAEGLYLHDKEVLVGPRTHDGKAGFHVITPFETLDNITILVNRGWIPMDKQQGGYGKPEQPMIVTGITLAPEKPNRFVPENIPAQDQWYSINISQIEKARDLQSAVPYILYLREDFNQVALPIKKTPGNQLNNNHRAYAIFWFTMAGILLVIYYLRFIRKRSA